MATVNSPKNFPATALLVQSIPLGAGERKIEAVPVLKNPVDGLIVPPEVYESLVAPHSCQHWVLADFSILAILSCVHGSF